LTEEDKLVETGKGTEAEDESTVTKLQTVCS